MSVVVASHVNRSPSSAPDELSALTRLEAERVRILDQLAGLRRDFKEIVEASAGSNADDEHDPEGSTIAFERSQLKTLIHQAVRHLEEIDDARVRVADRRYGRCETCGQPISAARLEARPMARSCIGCAAP